MKIKISDITRLVLESINEAGLGKNLNFGKKPAVQAQPVAATPNTPIQNTPSKPQLASMPSTKGGQHFPDVAYCFTEHDDATGQDIIRLGIVYIFQQHIPILQKAFDKAKGVFSIVAPQGHSNTVEFDIPSENVDTFKQIVPLMKEYIKRAASLSKNTKYDEASLNALDNDIITSLDNCPSVSELQAFSKTVASNYREMMNKLNDPVFLQKLNAIVAFYPNNGEYADIDHQLTDADKAMILAQDHNATYVTTEIGWNRMGREIIDKNRYILCKKPNKKFVSTAVRDSVARSMGFAGIKDYNAQKAAGRVPSGKIHKFNMACQLKSDDKAFIYMVKMYDVANTSVIPGEIDKFTEEERFIDNLRGLPNAVARNNRASVQAAPATNGQTQQNPSQAGTLSSAMLMNGLNVLERAVRTLNAKLDDRAKIKFIQSGNVAEDIGALIEQYELRRAQYELRLPKKEEQETYASSIAACVSAALGIENATTKKFIAKHGTITDTEAQDAYGEFSSIINAITSKKGRETGLADIKQYKLVGESKIMETVSYEQFKGLLNQLGVEVVDNAQANSVPSQDMNVNSQEEVNSPEEENIEIQDSPEQKTLQESFFHTLDKIEHIW